MSPETILPAQFGTSHICHHNSFKDQAPIDFAYEYLTLKWVALTLKKDTG